MKKISRIVVALLTLALFAGPVLATECKTGKTVREFSPPPGSYQQIPLARAKKMKNYIGPKEKSVSIQGEYAPPGFDQTK